MLFGLYSLFNFLGTWETMYLVHMVLASFIYTAAGIELARVLAEERPRDVFYASDHGEGIWTAPPGFRWVNQGNGVWHLAPIVVTPQNSGNPSPWVGA
jgi:hypothetical protein